MILGFIGTGNMAGAIIGGIIRQGMFKPEEIIGADIYPDSRERMQEQYGIQVTADNGEVASRSDILFLAVKPQFYAAAIAGIKDCVKEGQLIISIAPGKTLQWLEEQFGKKVSLIRTMPNTPAMVGEGMTAVCANTEVNAEKLALAVQIMSSFGKAEVVPEYLMDAVVAVSGSSPAYVFMFIEAMADAAVAEGMPRAQAYQFAAQAVYGSARMVLESGKHPGELKDMVCSPGGTTIEAVCQLEKQGFRNAVIEAMRACAQKARSM